MVLVSAAGNGIGRAIARRMARGGRRAVAERHRRRRSRCAWPTELPRRRGRRRGGARRRLGLVVRQRLGRRRRRAPRPHRRAVQQHRRLPLGAGRASITDDDWRFQQRLTLDTVFYATRAVLPHMVAAGRGSIVSMSSGAGIGGQYDLGGYAAAKAGVINLMETVATEYGPHGIRANAVTPGPTETAPLRAYLEQQPGGVEAHVRDLDLRRLSRARGGRQHRAVAGLRRGLERHRHLRALQHPRRLRPPHLTPHPASPSTPPESWLTSFGPLGHMSHLRAAPAKVAHLASARLTR